MLSIRQQEAKDEALQFLFTKSTLSKSDSKRTGYSAIGVGIGAYKTKVPTDASQEAVRIYVQTSLTDSELKKHIPSRFNDLPTIVLRSSGIKALTLITSEYRLRCHRPVYCGVSIGHSMDSSAGTLGCLVERQGIYYILSNNHVIAKCNAANLGDKIIQAATIDGGFSPKDNIASLSDFQPISFGSQLNVNEIDAAIGQIELIVGETILPMILEIGVPAHTIQYATLDRQVRKHGRTTGLTNGFIVDLSADLLVAYVIDGKRRTAWFKNQIGIESIDDASFSDSGDSGSLIVDHNTLDPIGLLFAGDSTTTFANPISNILTRFGISIA